MRLISVPNGTTVIPHGGDTSHVVSDEMPMRVNQDRIDGMTIMEASGNLGHLDGAVGVLLTMGGNAIVLSFPDRTFDEVYEWVVNGSFR